LVSLYSTIKMMHVPINIRWMRVFNIHPCRTAYGKKKATEYEGVSLPVWQFSLEPNRSAEYALPA